MKKYILLVVLGFVLLACDKPTMHFFKDEVSKKKPKQVNNTTDTVGYLVYTALLMQSGTNAPVATVLTNTLGRDVVWFYSSAGSYYCQLTNTQPTDFPFFKTWIIIEQEQLAQISMNNLEDGSIQLVTDTDNGLVSTNNILAGTSLEIRVYP